MDARGNAIMERVTITTAYITDKIFIFDYIYDSFFIE